MLTENLTYMHILKIHIVRDFTVWSMQVVDYDIIGNERSIEKQLDINDWFFAIFSERAEL